MVGFDKILHFLFSFAIALFDPIVSFMAGIGKECYDAVSGGVADIYDLLADWIGIACEQILRLLLS